MAEDQATIEKTDEVTAAPEGVVASTTPAETSRPRNNNDKRSGGANRRRRTSEKRPERARSEYDHKIVSIRRVARVVAGGRRFNFSVALVAGNRKGQIGVGTGKAGDTALAIEKAMRSARRNMITVALDKDARIRHEVSAKYGASQIMIVPVPGRGMVAGSSVRTVLELAGIKDVMAKILSRSKNQLNNARAAISALGSLRS